MAAPSLTVPPFTPPSYVVGAAGQAVFPFAFPFWEAADVLVLVGGVALDPSTYTVQGFATQAGSQVSGGFGSGQVTLAEPVANATVVVDRFVQPARSSVYGDGAPLPVSALNADLNRSVAQAQDIQRQAAAAPSTALAALTPQIPSLVGAAGFAKSSDVSAIALAAGTTAGTAAASGAVTVATPSIVAQAKAAALANPNTPGNAVVVPVGGTLPSSILPTINVHDFQMVANQTARLALTEGSDGNPIQPGAQVLQSDVGFVYILGSLPPSTAANWVGTSSTSQITADLSTTSYRVLSDPAAAARSQPIRQADAISLRDYCVMDGATDDTAAFNAWLAQLQASGRSGWVPQGKCRITAQPATITQPVSIYGEGMFQSELFFDNCAGLFVDLSATQGTFNLDALSLVTNQAATYGALTIVGSDANHSLIHRDFNVSWVAFRGPDLSFTKGWNTDLDLINCCESQVNFCMFAGTNQGFYQNAGTSGVPNRGIRMRDGCNNVMRMNPHYYWKYYCEDAAIQSQTYTGDGSTKAFAFTFAIGSTAGCTALVNGVSTSVTVTRNGLGGGTATFATAPASGATIVLQSRFIEPGCCTNIQVQASMVAVRMTGGGGGPIISGGSINVIQRGFIIGSQSAGVNVGGGDFTIITNLTILRNFGTGALPANPANWYSLENYASNVKFTNTTTFLLGDTQQVSYPGGSRGVSTWENSAGIVSGGINGEFTDNQFIGTNIAISLLTGAQGCYVRQNRLDALGNTSAQVVVAASAAILDANRIGENYGDLTAGRFISPGRIRDLPACEYFLSNNFANQTGDGTAATIVPDTVVLDYGGLYTGGGVFTIIRSGVYDVELYVRLMGVSSQIGGSLTVQYKPKAGGSYGPRATYEFNAQYEIAPYLRRQIYMSEGDSFYFSCTVAGSSKAVGFSGSSIGSGTMMNLMLVRPD